MTILMKIEVKVDLFDILMTFSMIVGGGKWKMLLIQQFWCKNDGKGWHFCNLTTISWKFE